MFQVSFYKFPFVFLTSYFCFGLCLATYSFDWELAIIFSLSTLVLLLFDWNFRSVLGDKLSNFIIPGLLFSMGYWSIYLSDLTQYPVERITNEPVTIEFSIKEITNNPSQSHTKGIGILHQVKSGSEIVKTNDQFLFYIDSSTNYKEGDRLVATTRLTSIENKGNPGEFDQENYWKNQGVRLTTFISNQDVKWVDYKAPNLLDKWLVDLHGHLSSVLSENLSGQELALAQALILGDKSLLNKETKSSFSSTGAMHVLAVSGMHIALILQLLLFLSSFFYRIISKHQATLIIVGLLWIYALLTGFSPSVIRAVFTFTMLALAQLSGNQFKPINILFFTALVLLVIEPHFFFDIGFQLSYLAMIGIYLTYEPICKWFKPKNKPLDFFWKGTAIGFSAQVMTIPLMLYYFHQFPNYFILSNLVLLVLSGIILGAGLSLFVTWKIPFLNQLNVGVLFISLWLSLISLAWIEDLPGAVAYGFAFPFILVPIMTISLYFMITLLPFSKIWLVTLVFFTLSLSWIVLLRWNNLSSDHLVLFNHSKLTFALKENDKIHCFIDGDSLDMRKASFILDAYNKEFPGQIEWHSIKGLNGMICQGKDTLRWESEKGEKTIKWKHHRIRIHYSTTQKNEDADHYMPWIEHPKSLKNGAFFYY